VQFAGRRLHGARVRKTHSSAFDAFADTPAVQPPLCLGPALRAHGFGHWQVGVLSMVPGVPDAVVEAVLGQCDGVVLRCFGSGTVPRSEALARALASARDREVPVLAVSQCAEGRIAMGTYAAGAVLTETGVVDGRDMTVEAAYAKMHHALAVEGTFAGRVARLARSLCGEMTP
jgi:L-asparaginase